MADAPRAITSAEVDAHLARAGMDENDGLRIAIVGAVRASERAEASAKATGREAAVVAVKEIRAAMPGLLAEVSWIKRLAMTAALLGAVGVTWVVARQVPVATPLGRMTPEQAETLRWNDLGPALTACIPQTPQGGRKWCLVGWWLEPTPPPK